MSRYAFAAAGTGGHVFPALAVAAELERAGIPPGEIFFMGGSRIEATAVPEAGYEFVELPLQGLRRSLTPANLRIPFVVAAATRTARAELESRGSRVMLATGGYVTVPAGWAARRARVPLYLQEQNAVPGLANRIAARWAGRVFLGFASARHRLPGEVTGNPVRRAIDEFDRDRLRAAARDHYGVGADATVLGVVGGSLGAGVINEAVARLAGSWRRPDVAIVHVTGPAHAASFRPAAARSEPPWHVVPFEQDMSRFYAAADVVLCRGSAMTIAELAVTGTPALLVPREAASDKHQDANAAELVEAGGAELVPESELGGLEARLERLLDSGALPGMAKAAAGTGRPGAAALIARAMREAVGDA